MSISSSLLPQLGINICLQSLMVRTTNQLMPGGMSKLLQLSKTPTVANPIALPPMSTPLEPAALTTVTANSTHLSAVAASVNTPTSAMLTAAMDWTLHLDAIPVATAAKHRQPVVGHPESHANETTRQTHLSKRQAGLNTALAVTAINCKQPAAGFSESEEVRYIILCLTCRDAHIFDTIKQTCLKKQQVGYKSHPSSCTALPKDRNRIGEDTLFGLGRAVQE